MSIDTQSKLIWVVDTKVSVQVV